MEEIKRNVNGIALKVEGKRIKPGKPLKELRRFQTKLGG